MSRFTLRMCMTLLLLACVLSAVVADDAWITAKYRPVSGGYRYYLTLYNSMATSTGNCVYALEAYVRPDLSPAWDLESPLKWDYTYISDWGSVLWATGGGGDGWSGHWYDGLPPGESLSGFNVTTSTLVSSFRYDLAWSNGTSLGSLHYAYAYPELVPEPSALVALAGGLGALGLPLIRRRKTS